MASTAASTCPASTVNWADKSFASAWNWPSNFAGNFPSTFAGNGYPMNFAGNGYPMNFAGNYPMNVPMNFGANFQSGWNVPSTFGWNGPSTFGGNFPSAWNVPSTFGWNWPSTFGGNIPSAWNAPSNWTDKNSWNRFNSCIRDAVFRPASMAEFWTFSNPIHVNAFDGSRMLYLCFDVKGFKPEECKVEFSAKDRCVTVTATHDVKEKEHTVTRNYLRKDVIPTEYCADLTKGCELKCHYTFDGLLVIEGFLPKMTAEELKTLREKSPSKLSGMTGAFCPAGFSSIESTFGCAIPIKTN